MSASLDDSLRKLNQQSDHNVYVHERLHLSGNSIRLIFLYPGEGHDLIRCDVKQFPVHRQPPYRALSYTWGSPGNEVAIQLNDKNFYVRRNLFEYLCQARQDVSLPLWIDALCINQNDIEERNHIVRSMDLIYGRAEGVDVWLGEADLASTRAIVLISRLAELHLEDLVIAETYVQDSKSSDWDDVQLLVEKHYWCRLWIVQEVILARDAVIRCGPDVLPFAQLAKVMSFVRQAVQLRNSDTAAYRLLRSPHSTNLVLEPHFLRILSTPGVRLILQWTPGHYKTEMNLFDLLDAFRGLECYDPRDGVFALLGLASDFSENKADFLDYALTPVQVFARFVSLYRQQTGRWERFDPLIVRYLRDALHMNQYPLPASLTLVKARGRSDEIWDLFAVDGERLRSSCRRIALVKAAPRISWESKSAMTARTMENVDLQYTMHSFTAENHRMTLQDIVTRQAAKDSSFDPTPTNPDYTLLMSDVHPRKVNMTWNPADHTYHRTLVGIAPERTQPGDRIIELWCSRLALVIRLISPNGGYCAIGTAFLDDQKTSPDIEQTHLQQLDISIEYDASKSAPMGKMAMSEADFPEIQIDQRLLLRLLTANPWSLRDVAGVPIHQIQLRRTFAITSTSSSDEEGAIEDVPPGKLPHAVNEVEKGYRQRLKERFFHRHES